MKDLIYRRTFLRTAGAAVASAVIAGNLFSDPTDVRASPSRVRRSVGGMSATDPILVSYAKAVLAMKALPCDNPLSWTYQAAIHGTFLQSTMPAWKTCEHGTPFFWPWHRMYIYWFERIVAKMADDPCWSLPYWNYTLPSERYLPAAFRDSTSPLWARRAKEWNDGTACFQDTQVQYSGAMMEANFEYGSSSIENSPHRNVHKLIQGLMSDTQTAAQDPIFFLHHSNIDRLWDIWLAQSPGAGDPLDDSAWKTHKFTFFDESGYEVHMTTCDVLRAQQQLGYSYEGEPLQSNQDCNKDRAAPTLRKLVFVQVTLAQLTGFPKDLSDNITSVQIVLANLLEQVNLILASKNQLILLNLANIEVKDFPAAVWDVFVGPPSVEFSGVENPFFVGTLALFEGSATFRYPINRALAETIRVNNKLAVVALIPHGPLVNGKLTIPIVKSPIRVGQATLSTEIREQC